MAAGQVLEEVLVLTKVRLAVLTAMAIPTARTRAPLVPMVLVRVDLEVQKKVLTKAGAQGLLHSQSFADIV